MDIFTHDTATSPYYPETHPGVVVSEVLEERETSGVDEDVPHNDAKTKVNDEQVVDKGVDPA